MQPEGPAPGRRAPVEPRSFKEVVPARAVLTELARGFLLSQTGDPERARQFASMFLRERAGRPSSGRIVPINRRPTVRRRVADGSGAKDPKYSVSSGYASGEPTDPVL
jgi:hypothetical protein